LGGLETKTKYDSGHEIMRTVKRNDPCPCGSGKKYKKCCLNKQPRDKYIYIGYNEPFQGVTSENGKIFVHLTSGEKVKTDAIFSRTQYTRKSGKEKILSSIPYQAVVDIPYYLASQFDVILAIDTNTSQVGNDKVSVASIIECDARQINPTQVQISWRKRANLAFRNYPGGDAEKFAWFKLFEIITSTADYTENLKIALVTDHDLANHHKYNTRELPIYQDTYLPSNVTLIYATSDAKENVLNTLIVECDKDASRILGEFEENGEAFISNSIVTLESIPDIGND
jgi:hypothetical protein